MPKFHVSSLDYDGCFAGSTDIIERNQAVLEIMKQMQAGAEQKVVFVGSNRQSSDIEIQNMLFNNNGLSFLNLPVIAGYLDANFDDFLIGDLYLPAEQLKTIPVFKLKEQDLKTKIAGFQYDTPAMIKGLHLNTIVNSVSQSVANLRGINFISEDKINIIYAQMSKMASDNPESEIVFDFYDDREDILAVAHKFFSEHSNAMIPKNVKLRFFKYKEQKLEAYKGLAEKLEITRDNLATDHGIHGGAEIDKNWQETVKQMTKIAERKQPFLGRDGKFYKLAECLDPRELFAPEVSTQPESEVATQVSDAPTEPAEVSPVAASQIPATLFGAAAAVVNPMPTLKRSGGELQNADKRAKSEDAAGPSAGFPSLG